jgi:lysophospholipase L1-like esterase
LAKGVTKGCTFAISGILREAASRGATKQFGGRYVSVRRAVAAIVLAPLLIVAGAARPHAAHPGLQKGAGEVRPQPITLARHFSSVQGLGDSVPAAANCGCTSYVVQLGQMLARQQHTQVSIANKAVDGQTSGDLLAQVTAKPASTDDGAVTVVTIGANDFPPALLSGPGCTAATHLACYQQALSVMDSNVRGILDALGRRSQHGPVLVTGYWNVFLDGQVGAAHGADYVRDSDALTQQVNDALKNAAQQHGDTYIDLHGPFLRDGDDTELLASDGDHPSAAGHALITKLLLHSLHLNA